jgi:phosphate-selective porin
MSKRLLPAGLRKTSLAVGRVLLVIEVGLVGSGCSDPSASIAGTSEPLPRRSASRTETNKSIKGAFTYALKTFDADGRVRSITGDGSVDDPVYRGKS